MVVSIPPLEFLYAGLMTFVIVSGLFYKNDRSPLQNIKKRTKQLFLGFLLGILILTPVMYAYLSCMGYAISTDTLVDTLIRSLSREAFYPIDYIDVTYVKIDAGYYFIISLFAAYLLFYIVVDRVISSFKSFAISTVALVTASALMVEFIDIMLPFHFHIVPMMVSFLLVGAYARKSGYLELATTGWGTRKFWIVTIAAFIIGAVLCAVTPTCFNIAWMSFGDYGGISAYPYFLLNVACGWVDLVIISFALSKIPILSNILDYVGKYTFSILLLHMFYAKIIASLFFELPADYWLPVRPLWFSVPSAILVIGLSILTAIVLKRVIRALRPDNVA